MTLNLKTTTLFIYFLLTCFFATAQEKMFSLIEYKTLSDEQKQNLTFCEKSPYTKKTWLVKIGDLPNYVQDGKLLFSLPDVEEEFVASVVHTNSSSENHFTWYGKLPNDSGEIMLITDENKAKYGHIQIEKEYYSIQNLGDGISVLIKQDRERYLSDDCPSGFDGVSSSLDPSLGCDELTTDCVTRVLVLYSNNVLANTIVANIQPNVEVMIEQTNMAFKNSAIGGQLMQVGKAQHFNFLENPTNIDGDVNSLNTNVQLMQLRNFYRADIVIMLTDVPLYSTVAGALVSGATTGFANINAPCAIVQYDAALSGTFTFSHEVGHLFNARHEIDAGALPGRAHSYGTRMSLVHIATSATARTLNYSNPSVRFGGLPTGTATRNNACNINKSFCTVASFMPDVMNLKLTGPTNACPIEMVTINAEITTEPPISYIINWSSSTFGANFQPIGAINQTLNSSATSVTIPFPANAQLLFVKLRVKQLLTNVEEEKVFIVSKKDCKIGISPLIEVDVSTPIYPNPNSGIFKANLDQFFGTKEVKILDIKGELLFETMTEENAIEIDVSKFNYSVVLLQVTAKNLSSTRVINTINPD